MFHTSFAQLHFLLVLKPFLTTGMSKKCQMVTFKQKCITFAYNKMAMRGNKWSTSCLWFISPNGALTVGVEIVISRIKGKTWHSERTAAPDIPWEASPFFLTSQPVKCSDEPGPWVTDCRHGNWSHCIGTETRWCSGRADDCQGRVCLAQNFTTAMDYQWERKEGLISGTAICLWRQVYEIRE